MSVLGMVSKIDFLEPCVLFILELVKSVSFGEEL